MKEEYPFESSPVTGILSFQRRPISVGYGVGADLAVFFSRPVGVGWLVRYNRASSTITPPSHTGGILDRRAWSSRRLARLGTTPDFHHGLPVTDSQMSLGRAITVFLLATIFMAGCRSGPAGPSDVSHGGPVTDYVSLVDTLRAAGATVDASGTVSQPFFAPQGQILTVNGEDVQAFEFPSTEEANAVAETVSADGSSIGTSMVGWVAPPHFYKTGKLIVIYVGSDGGVISALQAAMGSQFAGG